MRAAIDDVHHRHRQGHVAAVGQVLPQRLLLRGGHGMGIGQRNPQQRVRTQAALVLGAVQIDQAAVQAFLVGGIEALQRGGDRGIDVGHSVAHALAQVTGLVAVTQFHGFLGAGRGARRHRGTTERAVLEDDFGFQRGVATAVEDFTGVDAADRGHSGPVTSQRGGGAANAAPKKTCRVIIPAHPPLAKSASRQAAPRPRWRGARPATGSTAPASARPAAPARHRHRPPAGAAGTRARWR